MRQSSKELGKFFQAAGEPERSAGYSGEKRTQGNCRSDLAPVSSRSRGEGDDDN
jgi:hypothetical protein